MSNKMPLLLGAVLAVLLLYAALTRERPLEYELQRSSNNFGVEFYRFRGPMTPAFPEAPGSASDFAAALEPAGLALYAIDSAVQRVGSDGYRWDIGGGRTLTVTSKTCRDDVSCIDRVTIAPGREDRLRNAADNNARVKYVTRADYHDWPFRVDSGLLRCDPPGEVILIANDQAYALNGLARHGSRRKVTEIQLPDNRPYMQGMYVGYGRLLDEGLALCGDR